MKRKHGKIIIAGICLFLLSFGAFASAATAPILKIGLNGFALDMTKTKGKVQAGNKMVPATISQNGTTYIAAPAIGEVIRANYAFDPKTNTFMFTSYKANEDDAKIKKLQAQVSMLKKQVSELQTTANEAEGWKEYRSKHFTMFYKEEYEKDVKQAAANFERGYEIAVQDFAGVLPNVKDILNSEQYPIFIYMHSESSDRINEGSAYNYGYGNAYALKSEIHVLTPSAYERNCCTIDMQSYDEDYFVQLYKHEFIHTPQQILSETYREKTGWFPGGQDTNWVGEGQAEYLAARDSDELAKNKAYWKPILLDKPEDHITLYKDNLLIRTPYVGGYMFTAFLYETYGSKKYDAFLTSAKPTLEQAFIQTFGSFEQVDKEWKKWLKK